MQTLEKNRTSFSTVALLAFWIVALIVLISTNYEMIAIFVDSFYDKVDTLNGQVIESSMAGY